MSLGLEKAGDLIPFGTEVEVVAKIRPGGIGMEGLLKRSSTGQAEVLDIEYTIVSPDAYKGRKLYGNMVLEGTTAGHATAGNINRTLLRAIFEAVNGIDPKDVSPEADAKRASATIAGFNGATFLTTLEIEPGRNGYRDKNVIGTVLRIGDPNYRKLEQPAPVPIERSSPPATIGAGQSSTSNDGSPGGGAPGNGMAVARPQWAK
jgi:hypothetical protein